MAYRWVEDSPTIHRLFDDEEYIGKLFYTILGDMVVDVTFITADGHRRYAVPLTCIARPRDIGAPISRTSPDGAKDFAMALVRGRI